MRTQGLCGIFFLFLFFGNEALAEESAVADSFDYPIDDFEPGSYGGRVFGCCSPRRHLGEDVQAEPLTPVRAIANGKILDQGMSGPHCFYGVAVIIEHTLLDGSKITSIYGHMSNRFGYKPKLSGMVKRGDVIGYVGHSGGNPPKTSCRDDDENGDGGPHLHFGLRNSAAVKYPTSVYKWVYYGYVGYGEDVDYDAQGKLHGGKFTDGKKFMDAYNEKYKDRDGDGVLASQGDCDDKNPKRYPGAVEACDGIDNDCDGEIDDGVLNACDGCGAVPEELCDGEDNDCDGKIDENFPNLKKSCTRGENACKTSGKYVCGADKKSVVCDAPLASPGSKELCDGADNDCDGKIDEDYSDLGDVCILGEGACQVEGIVVCNRADPNEKVCSVAPDQPTSELCDGIDNDCDGTIDNGYAGIGESCTIGVGTCEDTGIKVCAGDGSGMVCSVAPLEPDCSGKQCGDDGCGGSCGTCASGFICNAQFQCALKPIECPQTKDCSGLECGPDPVCGESCGVCTANENCVAGQCECIPDCSGKECGDDGCGGSCGECGAGKMCDIPIGECADVTETVCGSLLYCTDPADACNFTDKPCNGPGEICDPGDCTCKLICTIDDECKARDPGTPYCTEIVVGSPESGKMCKCKSDTECVDSISVVAGIKTCMMSFGVCVGTCTTDGDCANGPAYMKFHCVWWPDHGKVCLPYCDDAADCLKGQVCDTDTDLSGRKDCTCPVP